MNMQLTDIVDGNFVKGYLKGKNLSLGFIATGLINSADLNELSFGKLEGEIKKYIIDNEDNLKKSLKDLNNDMGAYLNQDFVNNTSATG